MAGPLYFDRVKETSTTTGTGTLTLAGAVAGFQSFSAVGNGNTCYYCIEESATGAWEVGLGTYTSAGTTLARTTVLASSTGSAISLAAGTKNVFLTLPATALGTFTVVSKTADESVTSSTVMQDDDDLQLTLEAGATYSVNGAFYADGATAGDMKIAYQYTGTVAAGTTLGFHCLSAAAAANPAELYADTLPDVDVTTRILGMVGVNSDYPTLVVGIVKTTTAGTFSIQWAQGASSATATRMRAGSFLQFRKVA